MCFQPSRCALIGKRKTLYNCASWENGTGSNDGVGPNSCMITDDCTKLVCPRVDGHSVTNERDGRMRSFVAAVRDDGSAFEVDLMTEDAVAHEIEMSESGSGEHERGFQFRSRSENTLSVEPASSANIRSRSNEAVRPNNQGTFEHGATLNNSRSVDRDTSMHMVAVLQITQ